MIQNGDKVTQLKTFSLEHYFDKEESRFDWKHILFAGLLVAVIFLYIGLAIGFYPPGKNEAIQTDGGNSGITDEISLTELEARVSNLEARWSESVPQPVEGDEPVEMLHWQINGRLQKRGSSETFPNVLTIIKVKGQIDGDWQLVEVMPGGDFSMQYVHQREALNIRVIFANIPENWQTELNTISTVWHPVNGEVNTFEARFEPLQNAPMLVVDSFVERTFSGVVTLSASSEPVVGSFTQQPQRIRLEEKGTDGVWQAIGVGDTGEDGRFFITSQSATDKPEYRLYAEIDPIYKTTLHQQQPNGTIEDDNKLVISRPQTANEINLTYEIITVTLPVNHAQLSGANWAPNPTEHGQQYFITEAVAEATASWPHVYLPPGIYQMEVRTPVEAGVNAQVEYIVEIDNGISEADFGCDAYISNQSSRDEGWWDFFVEGVQTTLLVQSNGGNVTVTVQPNSDQADATLGLGPIRFVAIQSEPERVLEPCSE